jgi:CRP/FNR family transcriptional regulator
MDKNSFLKNLPIFKNIPSHDVENISRMFVEDNYDKDEYIFYEGENCDWLYIVHQGRVKIIKHSPSGKDVIIDIIPPGEIFGTVALLSGDTFPASAIAGEPTVILKLSKGNFYELERRFPGVIASIAKTMGKRLVSAHEIMQTMAVEKVEVRIAKALLKLSKEQSSSAEEPITITRQELADMIGTTVETSIRVLSKFEKKGFVASKRGKIWIKKLSVLEKMVNEE